MDSVRGLLLFAFCVAAIPAYSQPTAVPPAMQGLWSGGLIDSHGSVAGQECSALTISEYQIRLTPVQDTQKLEGIWIRTTTNMWMSTENQKCRWFSGDATYQPLLQTTWFFLVHAVYDSAQGVLKADGTFANCDGNGCNLPENAGAKQSFHRDLTLTDGRLVASNTAGDPSNHLEFVPVTDGFGRIYDATTASVAWLKILDSGDYGRFYDQATSSQFRSTASRKDFIARLSSERDRTGLTISRQTKSLYAEYAPFISSSPGQYVLFWSGVESSKSGRGLEFLLLANDGGTWKVSWLDYIT